MYLLIQLRFPAISLNVLIAIVHCLFHSYLHSCSPPIILGNLTCDTIFIHNNGLIKIGSVAPDAIHYHVKTCRENIKNVHFIAPEYGSECCVRRTVGPTKIRHYLGELCIN